MWSTPGALHQPLQVLTRPSGDAGHGGFCVTLVGLAQEVLVRQETSLTDRRDLCRHRQPQE
ncbi:hypothetical protein GCM10022207_66760 [Streptomyces lannensis]|uniref:Uncharacterized protein n=1 Tax=Streptomyces lannensis TaxID=766498 RepID=A0ABP7KWM5_9ACTN